MPLVQGNLPIDAVGHLSQGGYAPGTGVVAVAMGTVSTDTNANAGGQVSAPWLTQNAAGTATMGGVFLMPQTTVATASTAVAANNSNSATIAAVTGKTNYLTGFSVTTQGGTGAAAGAVTVTGVIGGTLTFEVGSAANAPVTFIHMFHNPLPASAVNTALVVNVPALGANTGAAACTIYGFTA